MLPQPLPEGACDCHVHVIGPSVAWPMDAARHYTPGPAPVAGLRAHMDGLGLQRAVVVQPSVYGQDNACLIDALQRLQGRARGVAVLGALQAQAPLRQWHACGVRGLRLNLESVGDRDARALRRVLVQRSAQIADLDWHLQVYAPLAVLVELADTLARLPVPVVLDHFALVTGMPGDGAAGTALLDLLRGGNVWIKLSAPYRLAGGAVAADAWARAFVEAAPARLLWGSDWPHTARTPGRDAHEVSAYRVLHPEALARGLHRWLTTPALRRQVLVDNPARLYGFAGASAST